MAVFTSERDCKVSHNRVGGRSIRVLLGPLSMRNKPDDSLNLIRVLKSKIAMMGGRTLPVLKGIEINIAGQSIGPFDFFEYPSLGALDANRVPMMPSSASVSTAVHWRVAYAKPFQTGGVLGLNFLAQHRARFNFAAQSLFLSSGKGLSGVDPAGSEGFTAVPIQITTTGRIEVSGLVGSQLYSFLVDTGSRRSVIDWKIKETNQIPVRYSGSVSFGFSDKTVPTAIGGLQNFKLGTLDVSEKVVQFASLAVSLPGFSHPFGGIIGVDLLWAHQAILDIGGRILYIK
jgi:hypothetical protein